MRADEEALEFEADLFDCETCPINEHYASLDADSRRAWDLTHLLCRRFLLAAGGLGPLLVSLTDDLDSDERVDLIERMNVIYDVLVPPPKKTKES